MRYGDVRRSRDQRGQSTTEFMLMVPVILSIFFFIINMSLYFTAVHYTNYAAFVTARSRIANFGKSPTTSTSGTEQDIAAMVLTGRVFQNNFDASQTGNGAISIEVLGWKSNFPFLSVLVPEQGFTVQVGLGKNEYTYEPAAAAAQSGDECNDNDVFSNDGTRC